MRIVMAVAFVLFGAIVCLADMVWLKDGRELSGTIISEDQDVVRLKVEHGEITLQQADIEKITRGKEVKDAGGKQEKKVSVTAKVEKLLGIIAKKDRIITRLRAQVAKLKKQIAKLKKEKEEEGEFDKELDELIKKGEEALNESMEIPFKGDETSLSKMKANGYKSYKGKQFILLGCPTVSDVYARGYRGNKKTHISLVFYEIKNKFGEFGSGARLYIHKSIGMSMVDAIEQAEKDGVDLIIRVLATIVPRKFDSYAPDLEAEIANWQMLRDGKWSKWVKK